MSFPIFFLEPTRNDCLFHYLDRGSLFQANRVSRYWKEKSDCPSLWERLCLKNAIGPKEWEKWIGEVEKKEIPSPKKVCAYLGSPCKYSSWIRSMRRPTVGETHILFYLPKAVTVMTPEGDDVTYFLMFRNLHAIFARVKRKREIYLEDLSDQWHPQRRRKKFPSSQWLLITNKVIEQSINLRNSWFNPGHSIHRKLVKANRGYHLPNLKVLVCFMIFQKLTNKKMDPKEDRYNRVREKWAIVGNYGKIPGVMILVNSIDAEDVNPGARAALKLC
jgi:hypothetical protein